MTFILAMANPDFVLQLSDRRLTIAGGRVVEEESTKAISLKCKTGRFAVAYTGVARLGGFQTKEWLISTLQKVASPEYEIIAIVERLCRGASQDFQSNPFLKSVPQKNKCLSIMFTGYIDQSDPPRMGNILVTNFQDIESGIDDVEAWRDFKFFPFLIKEESLNEFSFVQRVGAWRAMTREDEDYLRGLMLEKLDPEVVTKRALAWFRKYADRPAVGNTVGKQINSILIHRDKRKAGINRFHTNRAQDAAYYPDELQLLGDQSTFLVKDLTLRPAQADPDRPFLVPKVGRRKPCPCGKSKLYKNCCGKK